MFIYMRRKMTDDYMMKYWEWFSLEGTMRCVLFFSIVRFYISHVFCSYAVLNL